MKRKILLLCCVLALVACGDREAEQRAAVAAQAAANETAAAELATQYDSALTAQNWEMARIHGAALLAQYPQTQAATQVEQTFADTKTKAEEVREQNRLSSLWNYAQVTAGKGIQRSAMIYSKEPVDVDGAGPRTVQLVFRDHPEWKRSAYLVLQAGDFRCPGGCQVKVQVDDGPVRSMAAWRPDTDEAIAMFITDHRQLWKSAAGAGRLSIEFPVKAGGTRTAVFETGGVDASRMPNWWN